MSGTANAGGGEDKGYKYTEDDLKLKVQSENVRVTKEVLKSLGYEGKELKDVLEEQRLASEKKKQAEKDKLLKDQKYDELRKKEKEDYDNTINNLRNERDEYKRKHVTSKIENALSAEAARQGAVDPEDVVTLLMKHVKINDDDTYEFKNDDGNLISTKDAVASLLESKPHLKKANFTSTTVKEGGGGGTKSGDKKKPQSTVTTGFEDKVDGQITQANMTIEMNALRDAYKGKHLDSEYNVKVNKILEKYKNAKS